LQFAVVVGSKPSATPGSGTLAAAVSLSISKRAAAALREPPSMDASFAPEQWRSSP
jgi:hypothetical protein